MHAALATARGLMIFFYKIYKSFCAPPIKKMNSAAKVLPIPNTRILNIDIRVWAWCIAGLFIALCIHVFFFSREHFNPPPTIMLLDASRLKLASTTEMSDEESSELRAFYAERDGADAQNSSGPSILLQSNTVLTQGPPAAYNLWNQPFATKIKSFILDQGQYGSCTANAMSYAYMLYMYRIQPSRPSLLSPSRMFWYALARMHMNASDGYPNAKLSDTGCYVEDIVFVPEVLGTITETSYPYTFANLNVFPSLTSAPGNGALANVLPGTKIFKFKFSSNPAITLLNLKAAIASDKAVLLGIMVYSSFMRSSTLKSGVVPIPKPSSETLLGGHCICLTGYDSATSRFSFKNSWGASCGKKGVFTIPFSYITNPFLTGDVWTF